MPTQSRPQLIDERVLKAQSNPIRAHILNILSEGPSSPARMQRRMENVSLNLVCHHVKVLREVGLIELVDVKHHGGRKEHIYRATRRQYFDLEEWLQIDPKFQLPIITTILSQISEDTARAMVEGKFTELPDSHLSRSPVELDAAGWQEVVEILEGALEEVLEAHARSVERSQRSGEALMPARVMIMQFPIGRESADPTQ
ncbi:MAG: winged helix-turn-helix domain-containing protein [Actinomycetota bacterium]|nr:winged helix-turn-helix domain-containing protein [Actinomycetota bacterium]